MSNKSTVPGLISVIIPVYNTGIYARECINSVLEQDYENIEVIVVNDGSTDESSDILRDFASRNTSIRLIEQSNQGLSCARNSGLETARGECLLFLDSDDMLAPGAITACVSAMQKFNCDMVLFDTGLMYENNRNKESQRSSKWNNPTRVANLQRPEKLKNQAMPGKQFFKRCIELSGYFNCAAYAYLVKKSTIGKKRFYPNLLFEDGIFTPLVVFDAENVVAIDEKLVKYRVRENSITNKPATAWYVENHIRGCEILLGNTDFSEVSSIRRAYYFHVQQLLLNACADSFEVFGFNIPAEYNRRIKAILRKVPLKYWRPKLIASIIFPGLADKYLRWRKALHQRQTG